MKLNIVYGHEITVLFSLLGFENKLLLLQIVFDENKILFKTK